MDCDVRNDKTGVWYCEVHGKKCSSLDFWKQKVRP